MDLWARLADFAVAVDAPYPRVSKWYAKDNIPGGYWNATVAAARTIGKGDVVTHELLSRLGEARRLDNEARGVRPGPPAAVPA